jgi:hypothetical protein
VPSDRLRKNLLAFQFIEMCDAYRAEHGIVAI